MAKSKQKIYDPIKANKAAHRAALISAGLYGIHKEKSIPSGKTYSRKGRNRRGLD